MELDHATLGRIWDDSPSCRYRRLPSVESGGRWSSDTLCSDSGCSGCRGQQIWNKQAVISAECIKASLTCSAFWTRNPWQAARVWGTVSAPPGTCPRRCRAPGSSLVHWIAHPPESFFPPQWWSLWFKLKWTWHSLSNVTRSLCWLPPGTLDPLLADISSPPPVLCRGLHLWFRLRRLRHPTWTLKQNVSSWKVSANYVDERDFYTKLSYFYLPPLLLRRGWLK